MAGERQLVTTRSSVSHDRYAAYDINGFQSIRRFKHFVGGFVLVLVIAVPAAIGYDIHIVSSLVNASLWQIKEL